VAIAIALCLVAVAVFENQYRLFYLCLAVIALGYGVKQLRKRDTPFERRERELRRRRL